MGRRMASAVPEPPDLMRCVCLHQVYLHPVFVLYMHLKIYVGVLGTSSLAGFSPLLLIQVGANLSDL